MSQEECRLGPTFTYGLCSVLRTNLALSNKAEQPRRLFNGDTSPNEHTRTGNVHGVYDILFAFETAWQWFIYLFEKLRETQVFFYSHTPVLNFRLFHALESLQICLPEFLLLRWGDVCSTLYSAHHSLVDT